MSNVVEKEIPELRLARYLREFVLHRTTPVSDIEKYDAVLWFSALRAWAQALSPDAQWSPEIKENRRDGSKPSVTFAPALILRKRRQVGMLRVYDALFDQLSGDEPRIQNTPHYKDLLKDNDGLIFLDYLSVAFENFPDRPVFYDLLGDQKKAVERGLTEALSFPPVHEKYRWMAGYHNFVFKRFVQSPHLLVGEDMDLNQTIDIYKEAASKVSTFLIDNIGFPEPQVLPQSLQDQE